jgi:antitoxin FitA
MPTLTIKNLPDDVYRQLKSRAAANRRSLNSEILTCLEQALMVQHVDTEEARARLARADAVRAGLERAGIQPLTETAIRAAKGAGRP